MFKGNPIMVRVSVAMATYNGSTYLHEQVDSILANLRCNDELVIADDGSTDSTVSIIQQYEKRDSRVKLLPSKPHQGVISNFSYALGHVSGDIVLLADQDDVWCHNKVSTLVKLFKDHPSVSCVLHDVAVVDEQLQTVDKSFFRLRGSTPGCWRNILKNSYMGNAMAFRSTMLRHILPIPDRVPMHDQWIGLINEIYGETLFYPQVLGLYRRHGGNVTKLEHGGLSSMLLKRIHLMGCLRKRLMRDRQ